jgi:hypothetical protein
MNRDTAPFGPRHGITPLQHSMLRHYRASTQRAPMDWPDCSRRGTSTRALVRRRLLSRDGHGRFFISARGVETLAIHDALQAA